VVDRQSPHRRPQSAAKAAVAATNWNNQVDDRRERCDEDARPRGCLYGDNLHRADGQAHPAPRCAITSSSTRTSAEASAGDLDSDRDGRRAGHDRQLCQGLYGGTRVKDYTGNIALGLQASERSLLVKRSAPGRRANFIAASSGYTMVIAASGTPAVTLAMTPHSVGRRSTRMSHAGRRTALHRASRTSRSTSRRQ